MKQIITIGIDIGTQYCSAGYVLDNEYHQIDFDNCPYGIPTTVCLRNADANETGNIVEHYGKKYIVESGTNAVDKIDADYSNGDVYILSSSQSIKTLMRKNAESVMLFNNNTSLENAFETKKLVYNFIWHVVDKIIDKFRANGINLNDYKLVVNMGYPGKDKLNSNEEENYKSEIADIVESAFNLKVDGANVKVKATSEAALAADLLKNICLKERSPKQKVCTIDVGAGTTDLAFLEWDEKENKYLCKSQTTCNFGGKSVDLVLGKELEWEKENGEKSKAQINPPHLRPDTIAKRKKWIFTGNATDGNKIVGYTNTYLSKKIGEYIKDIGIVTEERDLDTLRTNFVNFINEITIKVENNEADVAFVLLGNSSHLSYIRDMIEETVKNKSLNQIVKVDISFLEDELKNTPLNYINNSNFIARAAAGYENDMITTNCYAFSYYNKEKNENGYKIISSKGNLDGYYYDTEADYMVDDKNNECDFNVNGTVYSIKILESEAMRNANVGKDFYYLKGDVPPKTGDGIAIDIQDDNITYYKPTLKKKGLRYNVGFSIDDQGKLSICVFANDNDEKTRKERTNFLKKAMSTAKTHGNLSRWYELANYNV